MIAGEVFWGLDAMPMATAFLDDPALFQTEPMARLDALPVKVQRRQR